MEQKRFSDRFLPRFFSLNKKTGLSFVSRKCTCAPCWRRRSCKQALQVLPACRASTTALACHVPSLLAHAAALLEGQMRCTLPPDLGCGVPSRARVCRWEFIWVVGQGHMGQGSSMGCGCLSSALDGSCVLFVNYSVRLYVKSDEGAEIRTS